MAFGAPRTLNLELLSASNAIRKKSFFQWGRTHMALRMLFPAALAVWLNSPFNAYTIEAVQIRYTSTRIPSYLIDWQMTIWPSLIATWFVILTADSLKMWAGARASIIMQYTHRFRLPSAERQWLHTASGSTRWALTIGAPHVCPSTTSCSLTQLSSLYEWNVLGTKTDMMWSAFWWEEFHAKTSSVCWLVISQCMTSCTRPRDRKTSLIHVKHTCYAIQDHGR